MGQTTSKQNQEMEVQVETKPIIKQEVPPPSSTFTPYLDLISIQGIESQFVKRGWPNFDNINDQIGLSPYPMLGVTALSLVTAMRYIRTPYGPFAQIGLLGTTGVFGLSSWTIKEDMDNGPSTATESPVNQFKMTQAVNLTITNGLQTAVEIHWNNAGQLKKYHTLQPSQSVNQPSFFGHTWVAIDTASGGQIASKTIDKQPNDTWDLGYTAGQYAAGYFVSILKSIFCSGGGAK
ncbi:hypothetical protein HDV02_001862 [Globomyces sp. JEL0801]|nr:hypothetical protein HDV02_001862 [Globomyces sp. JEL0801]